MPSSSNSDSKVGAQLLDASQWACIELTGEDRLEWLQGQATNDVRGLKPGRRMSFCWCEPTGGLAAVFDAWALEDRILLTTARELQETVLDRVERMTILEDVTAHPSVKTLVSIQGSGTELPLRGMIELPSEEAGVATLDGHPIYALRSNRTARGGWDFWVSPELSARFSEKFPAMSRESYEAERLGAGIPKWGIDMGPKTLPPELGPAFEARHISYQKGCYTGQEVLMRIHSRGHTNRTWVGLSADAPLPIGAQVEHDGKVVGTISSSAESADAFIGGATLRNEAARDGERVDVAGVSATVRAMPLV